MISSLRGTVLVAQGTTVVVEVGGVGFSVAVPTSVALAQRIGGSVMLHTALIVREDEMSLFGFADVEDLQVFDRLRGVGGVGPKSALAVLSAMTSAEVAAAVAADDEKPFQRVSGIGPKTAKLIVVSLAGKLDFVVPRGAGASASATVGRDVVIALVGLGWSERDAARAVDDVLEREASPEHSVPALLRLALAELGPRQPERA